MLNMMIHEVTTRP